MNQSMQKIITILVKERITNAKRQNFVLIFVEAMIILLLGMLKLAYFGANNSFLLIWRYSTPHILCLAILDLSNQANLFVIFENCLSNPNILICNIFFYLELLLNPE